MDKQTKKQPERTCVVCRRKSEKQSFIKIVRANGDIVLDREQKINGRGMYVCKNAECIQKAIKIKAINRCFKKEVPTSLYEELNSFEKPE